MLESLIMSICIGCWPYWPPEPEPPPPPQDIHVRLTMFIPLDHVVPPLEWWNDTFGADNTLTWDPSDSFRVQQEFTVNINSPLGVTSYSETPGIAREYDSGQLTARVRRTCVRKHCPECPTYPGGFDIVWQGMCLKRYATPFNQQEAGGMGSVDAWKVPSTQNSLSVLIKGSPYNPLVSGGPKIDYTFTLKIDYNPQNGQQTYRLTGIHDGFPAYQLDLNGTTVWSFDPIIYQQTPLSLIGIGEWLITGNQVSGVVP